MKRHPANFNRSGIKAITAMVLVINVGGACIADTEVAQSELWGRRAARRDSTSGEQGYV